MNEDPKNDNAAAEGDEDKTTVDTSEPASEIPTHDREFARIKRERDEFENKLQHAMADLANIRRRQRQEMDESRHRVVEGLTQELLPVLDTFSMALAAYDAHADGQSDPKSLVDGVRLVRTMLSSVLERHGLQEIRSTGPFDPNHHEAIAVEAAAGVPEGHIVRVMLTGYLLGERVVRPSRVVVSGNPVAEDDTKPTEN
ncbi:MAG: nucleotide exchange factor GrpE [Planctomycetes bacterium]|nr:nucleotide exchange factor GrpE [Planctomycetota bacterium]